MRSLVIGGNGFIGTHLVDRLLETGADVRVYGRSPNRYRIPAGEVEYLEGDLGNAGLLREAVYGSEIVYHLVSTTLPKTSNDDPVYDVRSNLVDTLQLLDICVESGVRKVVFTSSGGTIYGTPESVPIGEEHPTNPINSYGIVKLAIEKYLELYRHLHGLDYVSLRVSNPYGPYQDPLGQQGVIAVFLNHVLRGEEIAIWGDGTAVRDYLYVKDLVSALTMASESLSESNERVLNIGSGQGKSLVELLSVMYAVTGLKPNAIYRPGRSLDVPVNVLEITKARQSLGWEPKVDLETGIADTWKWIKTSQERS